MGIEEYVDEIGIQRLFAKMAEMLLKCPIERF